GAAEIPAEAGAGAGEGVPDGAVDGAGVAFFFQAEDGIRDDLVTGVQTCALPILNLPPPVTQAAAMTFTMARSLGLDAEDTVAVRSEERRVGKECRARCWAER